MRKFQLNIYSILLSLFVIITLTILNTCKNNSGPAPTPNEGNHTFTGPDTILNGMHICNLKYINDYGGTTCCISGPILASPGDTLNFQYNSNLPDSGLIVRWQVVDGSLNLLSGQNTQNVKFIAGDDFNGGKISGYGSMDSAYVCTDELTIIKK